MRIITTIVLGCIALLGSVAATDQVTDPVPAPIMKVGETWTFDITTETGTSGFARTRVKQMVERVSDDAMLVGVKQDGAPGNYVDHQIGTDWSLRIIANGVEVTTARPFSFPMRPGQSWTVDFENSARFGAQTGLHVHRTYKVVGWEDITVAAGTFHALKIESNGTDRTVYEIPQSATSGVAASANGTVGLASTQRGGYRTIILRQYSEMYYAPQIKNFVKYIDEHYNESDVRVGRETQTLAAYTPAS